MSASGGQHRHQANDNHGQLFGFEVLFRTLEIKSRADALVAAVHWILITDGFRSITEATNQDGQQSDTSSSTPSSELLPAGWNDNSGDFYELHYVLHSNLKTEQKSGNLILKIVIADGILIVSARVLRSTENLTTSVSLSLGEFVTEDVSNFATTFNNLRELQMQIDAELIGPLNLGVTAAELANRNPEGSAGLRDDRRPSRRDDDLDYEDSRSNPTCGPYHRPAPLGSSFSDEDSPPMPIMPPIGRGDLDPLGRSQGGMVLHPRDFPIPPLHPGGIGPGRLPRGSVPPGARFDPFGPPIPDHDPRRNPRFAVPDPDHFRPPPGYDDMFG